MIVIDRYRPRERYIGRKIDTQIYIHTYIIGRQIHRQIGTYIDKQIHQQTDRYIGMYMLSCFSQVRLFATPWTVACQSPLSMGLSWKEHWSGLTFPPSGDLPSPGIEPMSPALQADSFPLNHKESPVIYVDRYIGRQVDTQVSRYIDTYRNTQVERQIHKYTHTGIQICISWRSLTSAVLTTQLPLKSEHTSVLSTNITDGTSPCHRCPGGKTKFPPSQCSHFLLCLEPLYSTEHSH